MNRSEVVNVRSGSPRMVHIRTVRSAEPLTNLPVPSICVHKGSMMKGQ